MSEGGREGVKECAALALKQFAVGGPRTWPRVGAAFRMKESASCRTIWASKSNPYTDNQENEVQYDAGALTLSV